MMDKIIGQKIREQRMRREINQRDFGRNILGFKGTDNAIQKLVSKIEIGERPVKAAELHDISKKLTIPYSVLFGERERCDDTVNAITEGENSELINSVRDVMKSGTKWASVLERTISDIKTAFETDKKMVEMEKRIQNLEAVTSPGHPSGTTPKSASCTGSKKKAV